MYRNDPRAIFDNDGDYSGQLPHGVTYGQGLDVVELGFTVQAWRAHQGTWTSGLMFGKGRLGLMTGLKTARSLAPIALADIALSAATAPRKHRASAAIGAAVTQGVSLVAGIAGFAVGGPIGATVASLAVDPIVRGFATNTVDKFLEFGRSMNSLHMGGDYEDTPYAFTMRQRAAIELNGSLLNARQYLGREAALMHF